GARFLFWVRFLGCVRGTPRRSPGARPRNSRSDPAVRPPSNFAKAFDPAAQTVAGATRKDCARRALARYRSELRAQAGQSCAEFRAFGRRESSGRVEVASAAATAHERDAAAETLWLYQVQEPGAHRQSDDSHDRRYVS